MKVVFTVLAAFLAFLVHAEETHAKGIVSQILTNVAKMKAVRPDVVPMAFWDFDGTIIKGDLSEGLEENGQVRFKGLIARTIEEGFTSVYPRENGWQMYRRDYKRLNEIGRWIAWPFNAQLFAGREVEKLDAFVANECEKVYRKWYFASSVRMMRELEKAGVENYVVSASPETFVRNTAASLGLKQCRMRAIRVQVSGGRLTTRLIYPLPFGEGKVENVRDLVLARQNGVAIAGFGNSYSTDGAFLRYIATQPSLPGGAKGISVMINGGKVVPGYTEHFITVNQDEVMGE